MIYGVINKQLRCLGAQLHILFQPPCVAMTWLTHSQGWRQHLACGVLGDLEGYVGFT